MSEDHYDLEQARKFLRMIDPDTNEFCFQFFRKTKEKDFEKPPLMGTLETMESSFSMNQKRGFNVTVVINETDGPHRKLADILRIRAAYIDFDSKLIGREIDYKGSSKVVQRLDLDKLKNGKFPPRLIIESSPGNYHAYWPLDAGPIGRSESEIEAAAEAFNDLQNNLAEYYTSDKSVSGLNWTMRVPGFWRFKEDDEVDPSLVSIIWENDTEVRYKPSMLLEGLLKANKPGAKRGRPKQSEEEYQPPADEASENTFGGEEARVIALGWLKRACGELSQMFEGNRDNLLNEICWTAGGYIAGGALDETVAKQAINDAAVASGLDNGRIRDKLRRVIEQGKNKPIVVDPSIISFERPHELRMKFLKNTSMWRYRGQEWCTLIYWTGSFFSYAQGSYNKVEDDTMAAIACAWLNTCKRRIKSGKKFIDIPFQAKSSQWSELVAQLRTAVQHKAPTEAGGLKLNSWMPGATNLIPVSYCVPFRDGIYDARNAVLSDPNPGYFNVNACQVNYNDLEGEQPKAWLNFLHSIFTMDDGELDVEAMELLQEWFGYVMTGDTSRHKFMVLVGPPRSGKGTIGHILTHILGTSAVGTFDFSSISGDFGLEDLIHKSLAISADVRDMTSQINRVLDVFLRMTSGDMINVNRKNKGKLDVEFPARVMLMANEAPEFRDSTGAIMSRLLLIQLHQSFVDREDISLLDKLKKEAPQIARWGLNGLIRLLENGQFTLPATSIETRNEIKEGANPLMTFADECIEFNPNYCCNKDWLYKEYMEWATRSGFKFQMHKIKFFRQFKGIFGDKYTNKTASIDAPKRVQYLSGVGIKNDPNKDSYTSVNPPMSAGDDGSDMREGYDERNPPPHF